MSTWKLTYTCRILISRNHPVHNKAFKHNKVQMVYTHNTQSKVFNRIKSFSFIMWPSSKQPGFTNMSISKWHVVTWIRHIVKMSFSANITLRRGVIWDLAQSARKNLKSHEAQLVGHHDHVITINIFQVGCFQSSPRSNLLKFIFQENLVSSFLLKSHLSAGWCLRLTPRPPRAECALTQSARKNRALWVFLCALG